MIHCSEVLRIGLKLPCCLLAIQEICHFFVSGNFFGGVTRLLSICMDLKAKYVQ